MNKSINNRTRINAKFAVILNDFILISTAFFAAIYFKRGNFFLDKEYKILLVIFYLVWLLSSVLSKKYQLIRPKKLTQGLRPFYRSFLYMLVLLLFVIFILKLFQYSRFIILISLIIYFCLFISGYILFYLCKWGPNVNVLDEDYSEKYISSETETPEEINIDNKGREVKESLKSKLNHSYLNNFKMSKSFAQLYDFMDSAFNLDKINASDSLMLDANKHESVHCILTDGLETICNLHKINDIKCLDEFFRTVNEKLINGGYFVGVVETLEQRLKRRYSRYRGDLKKFSHYIDFIWTRVIPKLPIAKKIYFMIHGKDRRIISKCEVLGRLHFSGFRPVKMEEIDSKYYFLVKRTRPPLKDENPSYGPVFKQKRIGMNGEVIYTYKFRTMHPYAEYIHKYMYEQNKLNPTGKIRNDMRVPNWGRFMRKYWIDELPMIINFLQGDLKLVGLRPLSKSFFSIYPEDLKKERIKHKPGLIPALYADLPHSIEDIWESERRYLKKYEIYGWRADLIYFFKIMNNIIFNGARSC